MILDRYLRSSRTTSRQFAEAIKVSVYAVHKWRRGARIPRPVFIKKIETLTRGKVTPKDWYK